MVLYPLFGGRGAPVYQSVAGKFIEDNPELVQAIKEKIKKL